MFEPCRLCAQMLGFLSADVIKVEDTRGGNSTRADLAAHREDPGSVYFLIFNSNKRAVTLDLKSEKGKEMFVRRVSWADVLVENFSPDMMDRLVLGWDELRKLNPRLIYAAIKGFGKGFGAYGPYSGYKGFEFVAQAMGGAMATTGYDDRPPVSVYRPVWKTTAAGCMPLSAYSPRCTSANAPELGRWSRCRYRMQS